MTKRKKINNNLPTINLRLPEDLKRELENQSYLKSQTVSSYVRELLRNYLSGELYEQEIRHYKNTQFITSLEFLRLVIWIYKKKENRRFEDSDKVLLPELISTLKRVEGNVPNAVANEFDKILFDVLRVKKAGLSEFGFNRHHELYPKIDLKVIEDFVLNYGILDDKNM